MSTRIEWSIEFDNDELRARYLKAVEELGEGDEALLIEPEPRHFSTKDCWLKADNHLDQVSSVLEALNGQLGLEGWSAILKYESLSGKLIIDHYGRALRDWNPDEEADEEE